MNFMFEWQEQYLAIERSERVRYCSCHEAHVVDFIRSTYDPRAPQQQIFNQRNRREALVSG